MAGKKKTHSLFVNLRLSCLIFCFLWIFVCCVDAAPATVRLGVYEMPPMVFELADGSLGGLCPEILNDIAEQESWEIQYVRGSKEEGRARLANGEIDLLVDYKDLRAEYEASDAVLIDWSAILCRADLSIESFNDLGGRKLAIRQQDVRAGGTNDISVKLKQLGITCEFVEVDDYREVCMLLNENQVDGGVVNHLFGSSCTFDCDVRASPIVFNPRSVHFLTPKDSPSGRELLNTFNAHLRVLKSDPDSVFNQAMAYYLGGGNQIWKPAKPDYTQEVQLTEEERIWLKEHSVVRIGVDPEFAPFETVSHSAKREGIAADYLQLISNRVGIQFELVRRPSWTQTVQAVADLEIDLLPCIGMNEERSHFMCFSDPYLHFSRIIVARTDDQIASVDDLRGKVVGVQANSSHHGYLKESTDLKFRTYPRYEEVMLALSRGEIDAAVGNLTVTTHVLHELMLTNVKLSAYVSPKSNLLYMGVRKDWPELISILNKSLQSITMKERNAIAAKWMPLQRPVDPSIDLTQDEREWLLMHPRIRVSWDQGGAPIEFADKEGQPVGISFEYLDSLSSMLGIEFVPTPAIPWQDTYARLLNHETDMATCLSVTEERLDHFDFSDSYLSSPVVLFGRKEMVYIRNMDELCGLRAAVIQDYATDDWITKNHPAINLTRVQNIEEAFAMLKNGTIDVFIGNVITGNYYLSKIRNNDIKIVGETPYACHLRMAVRKDWPVFTGILRKAMQTIPEKDATAFYRNWVWLKYEHGFDHALLFKILTAGISIILVILIWNRRLKKEIKSRERAENALSRSQKQLSESYADLKKLEELKENLMNMVMHDMRSPLQTIGGTLDILISELKMSQYAEEDKELLFLAKCASCQLIEMVQVVLDISRLETHRLVLKRTRENVLAIAEESIHSLKIQLDRKSCTAQVEGHPAHLDVDANILRRVFINLIENAIKASGHGGDIIVRVIDSSSHMIAEVQDWGCGIPDHMQSRVFDKFCRIETDVTHCVPSVGLGLTFCKMAIEAHAGSIEVESKQGEGTIFRLQIPKDIPATKNDLPQ